MKKSMVIACLALLCSACAFVGCTAPEASSQDGYYKDEEVVVGGNSTDADVSQTAVLVGAEDIYLTKNATKAELDALTGAVYALKGEERYPVAVVADTVTLGMQGIYTISYAYEDIKEEYKVYIYGDIKAGADNTQAVSFPYSKAYTKLTDGVTFTDSFGVALETQVLSDSGMANKDGSLNVGTFDVTYTATDKAGQSLSTVRKVTVTEERTPVLADLTYDMADEGLYIQPETADYNAFLAISVNGVVIPNAGIVKEEGKIFIDGDYIYDIAGNKGVQTLRYLSAKGYKDVTLTLTDEKTVAIDDSALLVFEKGYYACGASYEVPDIVMINKRQSETPVLKMYKNGNEVGLENGMFTPVTDGTYQLRVSLRNDEYTYTLTTYYDLGLKQGMVFTQTDGILTYFDKENYALVECRVRSFDKTKTHALYKKDSENFGDIDAFDEALRALNKNGSYYISVIAKDETGKEYSQQVRCMVAGENTQSLLSIEADALNVTPNSPDNVALTYDTEEVAGKRGVFRYEGLTDNTTDQKGMLLLNQKFLGSERTLLKKDTFITFEMYIDGGRCLPVFCVDGKWYHEFYDGGGENVKFYDENGKLLAGSYVAGTLCNRWVTVEIKLHADMTTTQYNGLSFWADSWGGTTLKGRNVYLANVRASTGSLVADTTKNAEISTDVIAGDAEIVVPDIWTDKSKLY